jgi:hypothetical protein
MILDVTLRVDTSPKVWLRAIATLLEFREKKNGSASSVVHFPKVALCRDLENDAAIDIHDS